MMRKKQRKHRLGYEITSPNVRVVGPDIEMAVVPTTQAREMARSMGKDLILINESADPPVARIDEYSRFLYNQEKAERLKRRNSQKGEVREIQLTAQIADNDLSTKAKKANELLGEGNKVKCSLSLRGRQKSMPAQGELVLLKFAQMCESGVPEFMPRLDGHRWLMMLRPKK